MLIRRSVKFGDILIALVTTSQEEHDLTPLKDALLALPLEGRIGGILHMINDSVADMVQSDETRVLYGKEDFYEELEEVLIMADIGVSTTEKIKVGRKNLFSYIAQ